MTKSSKSKLAYQAEYNSRPAEIAKRVANNAARREAIRAGQVSKGEKRDIAHIVSLEHGGSNKPSNLKVESQKSNRGWRKGSSSYNPDKKAGK